jgi:hypothetical protein
MWMALAALVGAALAAYGFFVWRHERQPPESATSTKKTRRAVLDRARSPPKWLGALSSRSRSRRSISDEGLPLLMSATSAGGFLRRRNMARDMGYPAAESESSQGNRKAPGRLTAGA